MAEHLGLSVQVASLSHLLIDHCLLLAQVVVAVTHRISMLILLLLSSNEPLLICNRRPLLRQVRCVQLLANLASVELLMDWLLLEMGGHEVGSARHHLIGHLVVAH